MKVSQIMKKLSPTVKTVTVIEPGYEKETYYEFVFNGVPGQGLTLKCSAENREYLTAYLMKMTVKKVDTEDANWVRIYAYNRNC
jgi:stalled ribosome rescue protein Dom34